ncbi:uncharacterized protein AKAME5_000879900 [Lates japonicus]|uniref:Uncharacterized protein n=1 Tax=Lates japonicus TaxID=270547 RepID=A0AAD3MMX5_LATJO|nr:uncharacterized protein AKAME5_000879900 [Lates japonicus]
MGMRVGLGDWVKVSLTSTLMLNSMDFTSKVRRLKLTPDDTMVSFVITSFFTCIPTAKAVETVRKRLLQDTSLYSRSNFTPDQICTLVDLCLTTTYFKYNR